MLHFRITLGYDGTGFVGWQRQAAGTSIQGLLEEALRALEARASAVTGAGRTDAGVHALGQVASFSLDRDIDAVTLARALNARLPASVRVWAAHRAPAGFHARFNARAKTYVYRISNGAVVSPFERQYAWHVASRLDVAAMSEAARRLEGCHDFAAFQAAGSDVATTVRTIITSRVDGTPEDAEHTGFDLHNLRRLPGARLITYAITGDGFLRHMVRNIVGTLVEIGLARRTPASMAAVLAGRDRAAAGPTAPAHGLFLAAVDYGGGDLADEP